MNNYRSVEIKINFLKITCINSSKFMNSIWWAPHILKSHSTVFLSVLHEHTSFYHGKTLRKQRDHCSLAWSSLLFLYLFILPGSFCLGRKSAICYPDPLHLHYVGLPTLEGRIASGNSSVVVPRDDSCVNW